MSERFFDQPRASRTRRTRFLELWIDERLEARIDGLNWQGAYSEHGINTVFLEKLLV
jgi:hypothetical protein